MESRVGPNSKHWFTASFLQPLYHCIMYRGTGIEFSWVPSHCCLYWNEMSNNLAIQVAVKKKCLSHHPVTYYYRLMRLFQYLRRMCVNKLYLKSKFAKPSCSRYLARVIYKLRLNTWSTKYSHNVTCVCKNIISVKHILLECSITTKLFQKKGYDFNACNTKEIFCIILILSILLLN